MAVPAACQPPVLSEKLTRSFQRSGAGMAEAGTGQCHMAAPGGGGGASGSGCEFHSCLTVSPLAPCSWEAKTPQSESHHSPVTLKGSSLNEGELQGSSSNPGKASSTSLTAGTPLTPFLFAQGACDGAFHTA